MVASLALGYCPRTGEVTLKDTSKIDANKLQQITPKREPYLHISGVLQLGWMYCTPSFRPLQCYTMDLTRVVIKDHW